MFLRRAAHSDIILAAGENLLWTNKVVRCMETCLERMQILLR